MAKDTVHLLFVDKGPPWSETLVDTYWDYEEACVAACRAMLEVVDTKWRKEPPPEVEGFLVLIIRDQFIEAYEAIPAVWKAIVGVTKAPKITIKTVKPLTQAHDRNAMAQVARGVLSRGH